MNSYPLQGFVNGNPTWSTTPTMLFKTQPLTKADANGFPRTGSSMVTSTGKAIMYDHGAAISLLNNRITEAKTGSHLEAFQVGTNKRLWRTQLGTHINYMGDFPGAAVFDVGNLVNNYAGGGHTIWERNIVTSYHGEFWKNGQTNMFSHFWDNGLALGQFGTTRTIVGRGNHAASGMAGNALNPQMVKHPGNGNLYLVHSDESDHAGLHLWELSDRNTITEQSVSIPFSRSYSVAAIDYQDLMSGLPFDDNLPITPRAGQGQHPKI